MFLTAALANWNDEAQLREIAELCEALCASAERHEETLAQGDAFLKAVEAWPFEARPPLDHSAPLPVAIGAFCGASNIDAASATIAYLQTAITNQLQAAIRLSIIGQKGAARILANLENVLNETADSATAKTLGDLGSFHYECRYAFHAP